MSNSTVSKYAYNEKGALCFWIMSGDQLRHVYPLLGRGVRAKQVRVLVAECSTHRGCAQTELCGKFQTHEVGAK